MDAKSKYLKYKTKYLELKQIGGMVGDIKDYTLSINLTKVIYAKDTKILYIYINKYGKESIEVTSPVLTYVAMDNYWITITTSGTVYIVPNVQEYDTKPVVTKEPVSKTSFFNLWNKK